MRIKSLLKKRNQIFKLDIVIATKNIIMKIIIEIKTKQNKICIKPEEDLDLEVIKMKIIV